MNPKVLLGLLVTVFVFGVGGIVFWGQQQAGKSKVGIQSDKSASQESTTTPQIPPPVEVSNNDKPMEVSEMKKYTVTLRTDKGDIVIAMNADQTPKTVENFVTLAKKGFYANTVFHRTLKGFMIQGGDPKGDGTGGPGYKFDDEQFTGEYTRGTVAMANAGPNTNGSQFFIMHADYPLPKNYVIFGKVIKGLEVVDAIAEAPVTMSPMGEPSKPVTPVVVKSVDVIEE